MATHMPSSLEIAQEAELRPIGEIAEDAGLEPDEYDLYGKYKAKVGLDVLERLKDVPDGKLICVTAITPTKAGEGKTTTSVSLTQGLGQIGKKVALCLREASLGPVFGIKGGAAGGGYAQVVPMEDLNLHFTGDIHAISAANNLLAAMVEAHLLHGNKLGIDPLTVSWRRCVDINDRALRQIVVGLGGRANGYVRETGFDITAASEVMAILAVARDLFDLRQRLGAITVGYSWDGEPVTAEQIRAAGAMTVLLKDAINRFPDDTEEEVEAVRRLALEGGAHGAELNEAFERGGEGASSLAEALVDAAEQGSSYAPIYPLEAPIDEKIEAVCKRVYGADGVVYLPAAQEKIKTFTENGYDKLPICMAKTHLSLSHDPSLLNAPTGFTVTVRDIRAYTGAGWLVPLLGDMQTMPGLGKTPAAFDVDIDENGRTVGLF